MNETSHFNLEPTGNMLCRIDNPEIWDKMHETRVIPVEFKEDLFNSFPKINRNTTEFYLNMFDDYCYLVAFTDGLCYNNGGMGWSFAGGEKPERERFSSRLVKELIK